MSGLRLILQRRLLPLLALLLSTLGAPRPVEGVVCALVPGFVSMRPLNAETPAPAITAIADEGDDGRSDAHAAPARILPAPAVIAGPHRAWLGGGGGARAP